MKPENNEENLSGGEQEFRTRGGAVGEDRSKGVDFSKEPEAAAARGGVVGEDRSKSANASGKPETGARGGAVGDDRSKGLGGSDEI
jgi:hypothetical protein